MKKLKFKKVAYNGFTIIEILADGSSIGSIEMRESTDENGRYYIDNIYIDADSRNKGYLRQILSFLLSSYGKLSLLPLPEHLPKFVHLGCIPYKTEGEDSYFCLG